MTARERENRPSKEKPDWFNMARYEVLSDLTAPGWAYLLYELNQLNQYRPPNLEKLLTHKHRFAAATAFESTIQADASFFSDRFPDIPDRDRKMFWTFQNRDDNRIGAFREVTPEAFKDHVNKPPTAPSADDLRAMVAAGAKLITVNLRLPVISLREVATLVGTHHGRAKVPIQLLDPFWYEDHRSIEAIWNSGKTELAAVQDLKFNGWILLAVPVGTSVVDMRTSIESSGQLVDEYIREDDKLARAQIKAKRLSWPKVAMGLIRDTPNQTRELNGPSPGVPEAGCDVSPGRYIIAPALGSRAASKKMDMGLRTIKAWQSNAIVPLFDLLAWKMENVRQFTEEDIAAWIWHNAKDQHAKDQQTSFNNARHHLAQALAVADRLRDQVLATWPSR